MTRKDYKNVADCLLVALGDLEYPERKASTEQFANALKFRYSNFDKDRFLSYCGW